MLCSRSPLPCGPCRIWQPLAPNPTMTTETIQPDVGAIDERISELRSERAEFLAQQQEADEKLARAIANRATDQERKKLNTAAATFADRVEELDGALRFLEADREIALQRAGVEVIRDARARMEESHSERAAAFNDIQRILTGFVEGPFAPAYRRLVETTGAVISAQDAYRRAVADDDVYDRRYVYELPDIPGLSPEDGQKISGAMLALRWILDAPIGRVEQ